MTEAAQHTADPYGEQLEIDFTGAAETVVSADIIEEVTHSPAYLQLRELRDGVVERRRSGSRAIARQAFAALQGGELSQEEFSMLFQGPDRAAPRPHEPTFEDLSTDRPSRELDWAERAAGEGVRRLEDE